MDLPHEVMVHIFSYLKTKERVALHVVSRLFQQIADEESQWEADFKKSYNKEYLAIQQGPELTTVDYNPKWSSYKFLYRAYTCNSKKLICCLCQKIGYNQRKRREVRFNICKQCEQEAFIERKNIIYLLTKEEWSQLVPVSNGPKLIYERCEIENFIEQFSDKELRARDKQLSSILTRSLFKHHNSIIQAQNVRLLLNH